MHSHTHTCTHVHACTHIHTCTHTYIHACTHKYMHAHIHICMHTHIYKHAHTSCMHTLTYMHAHSHTHTHTCLHTPTFCGIQIFPFQKSLPPLYLNIILVLYVLMCIVTMRWDIFSVIFAFCMLTHYPIHDNSYSSLPE